MRRLYVVLPDHDTAEIVVDELLLKRVDDHHIHVVAKEGATLSDLPEASIFQKTDFIPAVERGLAVGGATGILAGLAAAAFPAVGLALGGGAVLGTGLAGAGIGAWVSGMIGLGVTNSQIKQFEKPIEDGGFLMMVVLFNGHPDVQRCKQREDVCLNTRNQQLYQINKHHEK